MPTKRNTPKTNVIEAMINRSIRNQYIGIITPNEAFYIKGDEIVPADIFEAAFPIEILPVRDKGELIGNAFA